MQVCFRSERYYLLSPGPFSRGGFLSRLSVRHFLRGISIICRLRKERRSLAALPLTENTRTQGRRVSGIRIAGRALGQCPYNRPLPLWPGAWKLSFGCIYTLICSIAHYKKEILCSRLDRERGNTVPGHLLFLWAEADHKRMFEAFCFALHVPRFPFGGLAQYTENLIG